jgi:hypothetical protein
MIIVRPPNTIGCRCGDFPPQAIPLFLPPSSLDYRRAPHLPANILQFGPEENLLAADPDCDFNFSNELTILGFLVTNSDDNFKINSEKIYQKVVNQSRIWTRYNLSLPGRIAICKTAMYSQLNYMGCVIPVPTELLEKIEDVIYKFISGNLRIAKSRVFQKTETGGLGWFN